MPLKRWKIISSVASGVVAVSAILAYFSIPINPCSLVPSQNADSILAPTTTKKLYDNAEVVVLGRITDSSAKCEGTQIWTHMQVQVEEYLKNPQESRTLTAKSIGGAIGNYGIGIEDSPIYDKGNRVLLYLYRENPGDKIFRISFPTGIIQDQNVTGSDLLKSISLYSATNDTIPLFRGTDATAVLSLESFFGYDSLTNVTATSFTFYNSSSPDYSNSGSIADLSDFGLSVGPVYDSITPRPNGTVTIEFKISATNKAIEGIYDIYFSAIGKDEFFYLNPSIAYTFVRVNVTDNGSISASYPVTINDKSYNLDYVIIGGRVERIEFDASTASFVIFLGEVNEDGTLKVHISKEIIRQLEITNQNLVFDDFIVFVDEKPVDASWESSHGDLVGSIPLKKGSENVEILGGFLL
jgi:hypothetical protein